MLRVEGLERRDRRHGHHHGVKRPGAQVGEVGVRACSVVQTGACASQSSGTSSGSASRRVDARPGRPARSRTRSTTGSRPGEGEASPRSSSPCSRTRRTSSPRSATTSSGGARASRARAARRRRPRACRRASAALGVHARRRPHGERTITTVGAKLRPRGHDDALPWHELAAMDAVFFVAGRRRCARHARRARVLTATSRELEVLAPRRRCRSTRSSGAGRTTPSGTSPAISTPRPRSS